MKTYGKTVLYSIVAITMIGFSGCGGNDGDSGDESTPTPAIATGTFIDSAVTGLNYKCSSGTTGITDTLGKFTCNSGDTVNFYLGKYEIGSSTVTSTVTPYSLYPNNVDAAINVAQLLQTIDDASDGSIVIPNGYSDLDNVTTNPTDSSFDSDISSAIGLPLVNEEAAAQHLNLTLGLPTVEEGFTDEWLNGKTLYLIILDTQDDDEDGSDTDYLIVAGKYEDGKRYLDFSADGTFATGSDDYVIDSNGILKTIESGGDWETNQIIAVDNKKLSTIFESSWSNISEIEYLFYNKSDAEAYMSTLPSLTIDMLKGKKITFDDGVILNMYSNMTYKDTEGSTIYTGTWSVENGILITDVTYGPEDKETITHDFSSNPAPDVTVEYKATQSGNNLTGTSTIATIENVASDIVPTFAVTIDMITDKKLVIDGVEINFYNNMTTAQNNPNNGCGVWTIENGVLVYDITTYTPSIPTGTESSTIVFDSAPANDSTITIYSTKSDGSGNDTIGITATTITSVTEASLVGDPIFPKDMPSYKIDISEIVGKKIIAESFGYEETAYFYENMTYKLMGTENDEEYTATGTWSVENGVVIVDIAYGNDESEQRVYVFDSAPQENSNFTEFYTMAENDTTSAGDDYTISSISGI